MEKGITCIVADDHPPIVATVTAVLTRHGVEVVATAERGDDAAEAIERLRPRVAVVDLRMPGLSGSELARRVARTAPQTACLAYTAYCDRAALVEVLDAGARGYVTKASPLDGLVRAVETVAAGGRYVDPALADQLLDTSADPGLTPRERDVLRLLADGHSNDTIGRELFISPDTARTQLGTAMAKLGASTRTQAVAIALRRTLIA
jgi:DNA-binding NarL/FixJ family response regulator